MQFPGLNVYAIVLAAVVGFMFGWLWYGVLFSKQWQAAVGKTEAELKAEGPNAMPFVIAFVAQLIMAWVLAGVIGHIEPAHVSLKGSLITAALVWLGFVATTLAVNHTFQGADRTLTLIDGGHWLGVLLLQGAVIGLFGFMS
jgi:hypothetical protein